MWRKNNQEITGGSKHNIKKRINQILAIDNSEILIGHYYKNQTISSTEFLCFLEDLIKTINEKKIYDFIFILDNATYHLSDDIKEFAQLQKLKFLFNLPYKSQFNAIEMVFHLIKNILYKEINISFDGSCERINLLINDNDINNNVKKVYLKTIKIYNEYYIKNISKIDLLFKDIKKIKNKKE